MDSNLRDKATVMKRDQNVDWTWKPGSANIKCILMRVSTGYCLLPVSLDYSGSETSVTRFLIREKLRKYTKKLL